ncbi:MAG TPA: IclR family transcriptional regulator [Streptosporangiaceae bacterium]|nr:IclR family transcriptional regulator [Streptosporangiaceae bacterium]
MQTVLNALRVLEEVALRQPAGVGELARGLGMPKSSVQRALRTLHSAGWIRPADGGVTRWTLTSKALHVGRHATGELSLRDAAVPIMEELRHRTGETIHLMVPESGGVVLIERLETPKPLRIVLPLGKTLPLHASANGKAVLAAGAPDTVDRLLGAGLPGYTDTTITDPARLRAELALIRERGYATNTGEWRSDIAAVAAAVLGRAGVPIASLSISTPMTRMSDELRPEYGKLVGEAAKSLGRALADL